jgi:hypothetical protein
MPRTALNSVVPYRSPADIDARLLPHGSLARDLPLVIKHGALEPSACVKLLTLLRVKRSMDAALHFLSRLHVIDLDGNGCTL